jgi:hypothetical protein
MRPPNGIAASRSLPRKKIASSTGSRWGEVTMRNVVAGSAEQRLDARGALGEAVHHAAERAEEDGQVLEQVDAGDALEHREDDARAAAHDARGEARGGEEEPQRAALEERREAVGRVEEVQRVARRRRVEDHHVEAARPVQLVELGDRENSWEPATAADSSW